jgi:hypothetical protein
MSSSLHIEQNLLRCGLLTMTTRVCHCKLQAKQYPSSLLKVSLQGCAYAGMKRIDLSDDHRLTF